jgi:ABC-type proline/glycine betaine transport system substrate-binding protein
MAIRRPAPPRWWVIWLPCVLVLLVVGSAPSAAAQTADPDAPTVRMARPTWDTGWFQAEIYRQLLVELGYDVVGPETMDNEQFYRAAARGDVDFWASGWFPLHQQYLDAGTVAANVDVVGSEVEAGALQGYFVDVPTAEARGIEDLTALADPEIAQLFDLDGNGLADLIGCNIEWACADIIAHHLEDYGLTDTVEQVQGDYSLLMREAVERYRAGRPVLFYTFTPNWTVGELVPGQDVVWLETPFQSRPAGFELPDGATRIPDLTGCASDPCQTGWPANDIQVVGNADFLRDNPAARRLLEAVTIPLDDILAQNAQMVSGEGDFADIERQAEAWIERNAAAVAEWIRTADPSAVPAATGQRAAAAARQAGGPRTLRVAARSFPPFVIYSNRRFGGFSVELMDLIGRELDADVEIYGVNSVAKQLDDVGRGAADVALAGIGITSTRESNVDFTHSVFDTGLQVMVPVDAGGRFAQARRLGSVLLRSNLLWLIAFFLGTLLLSSHVIWWFERRDNPEFDKSYPQGIWDSFWWSTVTLTTVGYGDKAPKGHLGRGWALLWMIAGYFVFASFTASITSSLAIDQLRGTINGPEDLNGNRVVTVGGTDAEDYLARQGIGPITVSTIDDAYAELADGRADAIAFDAPVLQFHAAHEGDGEVRVVGPVFEQVRYGLAVQADSDLRERINVALLDLVESGAYDRLHDEWFGATAAAEGG